MNFWPIIKMVTRIGYELEKSEPVFKDRGFKPEEKKVNKPAALSSELKVIPLYCPKCHYNTGGRYSTCPKCGTKIE